MQDSSHTGQDFQAETTIEIHLVRPTEVCVKVLSEKNGYKSVKTSLLLSNAVCLPSKAIFYYLYWF